jgi:hypothetical protein
MASGTWVYLLIASRDFVGLVRMNSSASSTEARSVLIAPSFFDAQSRFAANSRASRHSRSA